MLKYLSLVKQIAQHNRTPGGVYVMMSVRIN